MNVTETMESSNSSFHCSNKQKLTQILVVAIKFTSLFIQTSNDLKNLDEKTLLFLFFKFWHHGHSH